MLALGTSMPRFSLADAVSGRTVKSDSCAGDKATLVMFICNHCPFVIHVLDELTKLCGELPAKGVGVVAINANDVENYPQDGPEEMKKLAASEGWVFPFLFDAGQNVAKEFNAACTPDFFLFDSELKLAYRGQLDDSRPGSSVPVTGEDLRGAIEAVVAGRPAPAKQKPSIGCNIKWKPGNEPPYFG